MESLGNLEEHAIGGKSGSKLFKIEREVTIL